MLQLILFFIYIFMILTVIFVERKRPTEALLWVVIMICIPYLGTVLYLIFGSTVAIKLTSFIRSKKLKDQPYHIEQLPKASFLDENKLSESDLQVVRFNAVYNMSRLTCYESAEFLTDGKSHYTRLFQDVSDARKCIFVEFYTIHHDVVGDRFVKLLTDKAKEGVEVWVMLDQALRLEACRFLYQQNAGGAISSDIFYVPVYCRRC